VVEIAPPALLTKCGELARVFNRVAEPSQKSNYSGFC